MKYTINDWIEHQNFAPGSKPVASTVRRWCEAGHLNAEKIGGTWYIDTSPVTNDPLLDKILKDHAA